MATDVSAAVSGDTSGLQSFHPALKPAGQQMTKGSLHFYRGVALVSGVTAIGRAHLLEVAAVIAVLLPMYWGVNRLGTWFYADRTVLRIDRSAGTVSFRGWTGDLREFGLAGVASLRFRALKHRLGQIIREVILEGPGGQPILIFNADYWPDAELTRIAAALGVPTSGGWTELLPYAQYEPNPPIRSDPTAPQVYMFLGFFFPMMIALIVVADHIAWLR